MNVGVSLVDDCSCSFYLIGILLGFLVFSRGSFFEDKIWDAQNIDRLPPEVRGALTRMCGPDLAAQRYFAGYFENSKFLVLHFGRLRCGEQSAIRFTQKKVDHYHLLKSYYGPSDD
jgi:hypothetical protein